MEQDQFRFFVAVGALFVTVVCAAIAVAAIDIANNHIPDEHDPAIIAACISGAVAGAAAVVAFVAASRLGKTSSPH